jgi:hypothetical protein
MVTKMKGRTAVFFGLIGLMTCLAHTAEGQGDVYRVAVKIQGGGPAVSGFLYAVNDTAVVILPSGKLSRKGFEAALAHSQPFSIPLNVVKKVKVVKVRSTAHDITIGFLVGLGYSLGYLLVVPIYSPAGLIPYTIVVTGLSILTLDLLYSKPFKTKDPAFKIKMQKYCLHKYELAMDR